MFILQIFEQRGFQMPSLLYRDVFWKYVDANTKRELGLDFRDDGEFYMNFNRDFLKVSSPSFVSVFFAPTVHRTQRLQRRKSKESTGPAYFVPVQIQSGTFHGCILPNQRAEEKTKISRKFVISPAVPRRLFFAALQ
jgi:hypothetical protein